MEKERYTMIKEIDGQIYLGVIFKGDRLLQIFNRPPIFSLPLPCPSTCWWSHLLDCWKPNIPWDKIDIVLGFNSNQTCFLSQDLLGSIKFLFQAVVLLIFFQSSSIFLSWLNKRTFTSINDATQIVLLLWTSICISHE